MDDISENLKIIRARMAALVAEYQRAPASVRLVAVSKMQPLEKIEAALAAGQRVFGENRVQEALGRWGALKELYPDIVLHLIGPLQTNKVKDAVALFDVIETVDRAELVQALSKEMGKQGRTLPCLIQVNTGEEDQKAGVAPQDLPELLRVCREVGLLIEGLMCIPPAAESPALHFAFLRKLAAENGLSQLSMGMSSDYEKAIPLGATYVRIGTGVFGQR